MAGHADIVAGMAAPPVQAAQPTTKECGSLRLLLLCGQCSDEIAVGLLD
jgi:hypothetical protein